MTKTTQLNQRKINSINRITNTLPGCAAWLALAGMVFGAIYAPMMTFAAGSALAFYTAIRFLWAGGANLVCLWRVRRWSRLDFGDTNVQHVVIIPNFNEPAQLLSRTLESLAKHPEVTVVLAMEAREIGAESKANRLKAQYEAKLAGLHVTLHPTDLPGEIPCKSANLAWAARWVHDALVPAMGWQVDHVLVTTMDADTQWHPKMFSALANLFANHPHRHRCFWQGLLRYHGNVWQATPPMRLLHAYSGAFEAAYLAGGYALPMSSYSVSLRLLDDVGYWDGDAIADEWHLFIKAFFETGGKVKTERVFLPFTVHATTGASVWDLVVNRYLQTLRHAWGSKEVGYTLQRMLNAPSLPPGSWRLWGRVAHDVMLGGAGWVIVTLGTQLPLFFHPGLFDIFLGSTAFLILQGSLGIVLLVSLLFWWLDVRQRPSRTDAPSLQERLISLVSLPLFFVMMFVFVALPTLDAQTRLLLGIPLHFRVTKKV